MEITSTALVPVTALTVWQNVNSQWDRLNQNFNRASHSLGDLQQILERVYEEKNKSFMEGFMQSQEAARRIADEGDSSRSRRSAGSSNDDDPDNNDVRNAKSGFMGEVQKIMKALDVGGFELITYVGDKAIGYMQNKKKEAAAEKEQKAAEKARKAAEPGFLSKTKDSLGSLDLGGVFDKVKSLGTKAIAANATEEDKGKWNKLQGNMDSAVEMMGQKAIVALRPILDTLNNAFQSEGMSTALNLIANAFLVIAAVIGEVVNGILYMFTAFQENWDVVGPILAAIAIVFIAAMIVQLYNLAAAWLVGMWPILLIVAAVALLIYILQQAGVSVNEVVAFIGGAFGWLRATIENFVIGLYNNFVSFADFFRNLFIDPTYAVQKLFYDLATNFLGFIYQMALGVESFAGGFVKAIAEGINFVLKGIQVMAGWLSKFPGFEFLADFKPNFLEAENPHVFSDMVKNAQGTLVEPTSTKDVYNTKKKEFVDTAKTVKEYGDKASDLPAKFNTKLDRVKPKDDKSQNPAQAAAANINSVNKVGEVGSINEKVDISSDDLDMLRELAEIQSIQNFVELTPTVQVTTGNINNSGDIDSIITKIGQKLKEEFVSTAQGVYT
ncbi:hypothetical protein [Paenibacillus sp. FSL H8-0259]|uniref:hypothetical protein n=1 Tax=Paenibacillus sp. FSL H8-0259 TaxID=1920423 RepID=UPI00096BF6B4|nr:hypothetical protein [Paenibacillus sp. FSL H8-0259]OMF23385.1 hypothetical protein BK132_27320 [Paenibacillus sp. FSL H8-0259]